MNHPKEVRRYYVHADNVWDAPPMGDGWSDSEPSNEFVAADDYAALNEHCVVVEMERDMARQECARLNRIIGDYIASVNETLAKRK